MSSVLLNPDGSRIHDAIEGLYAAFSDAKRPSRLDMSPVQEPNDFSGLMQTPLRELTAEQLWHYSFSVFLTVGDISDFEYFFPRIIEIASDISMFGSPLELEVVFQKPSCAGWPDAWRHDRRQAFQTYLEAVVASWASLVWDDIDRWICALSFCLDDINSRLEILVSGADAANQNLISFYEANSQSLTNHHRLGEGFWSSSPMHDRVASWLERPDVQLRIQQLYDAGVGSERFESQ